ncbi:PLP-dependent aminotransferase family protein [Actinocrispum wychmicini]|uniref:DNA-binding transcriptional MocR family regulator n=1 Tax=Actinocrispum wychmicini TaxID=1213861 RepID=A0A4R2JC46_9PSEU|nr:PLP-dependent aminotransferase family protein [Actinocrispum wychmicini]TCO54356.1 DNA-binding transcriptional MocR family regulator [Actinocrispum wychmicini]
MDVPSTPGPLYVRVADGLREAIRQGEFGAGERLPSDRDLARDLDVSRTTTIAAYRLLRAEGLLESTRGSGTRVATSGRLVGPAVQVGPTAKLPEAMPPDTVDLAGSLLPGLDVLPDNALHLGADEMRRLAVDFEYEPLGLPALREAIAARYTRAGLPTTTAEVLVTTGAQQAIQLLFALFGQGRGVIATENPTYAGALDAARTAGATLLGLPCDAEGIRVRALREALDSVRLVYLMSTCQNPTGTTMSAARRREITRLAASTGTPVVDDTTLAELTFDERPYAPLGAPDDATIITVGSLSKLFWAGLRVGWIRAPEQLLNRLARLKATADLGSSHVSQLLALRLLPTVPQVAATQRARLVERLDLTADLLRAQLPSWSWTRPAGGPFLWVRLPHGTDAARFARVALRCGVRVLPGARTSPDSSFADHLRMSYVDSPDRIREAVDRLARAWANHSSASGLDRPALDVVV